MKVNELIKKLKKLVKEDSQIGNAEILLSSDPEGNGFHPLDNDFGLDAVDKSEINEPLNISFEDKVQVETLDSEHQLVLILWSGYEF